MDTLYNATNYLMWFQTRPPTWKRAEAKLREEYDLVKDHTWWHDARKADDTPVELKSCACEYADGRLCRFKIWEFQLDELGFDGEVGLLMYTQGSSNRILATHMLPAHRLRLKGTVSTNDSMRSRSARAYSLRFSSSRAVSSRRPALMSALMSLIRTLT
jgi:hypothetical protein